MRRALFTARRHCSTTEQEINGGIQRVNMTKCVYVAAHAYQPGCKCAAPDAGSLQKSLVFPDLCSLRVSNKPGVFVHQCASHGMYAVTTNPPNLSNCVLIYAVCF